MDAEPDTGYMELFAHPEMVRDLLRDWVPGEWVEDADFSTLERINSSYVPETEKQQHDDMVWRLRVKENWMWVYLILVLQPEPDPWMALRMQVNIGLLALDLVERNELVDGLLPTILPLVLYNGLPEWTSARDVGDLYAP